MHDCPNCGSVCDDSSRFCSCCGARQPQTVSSSQPPEKALGMGWFKYIIWFQLFANGLLNVSNAIACFSGRFHGRDYEILFSMAPEMKSVTMLYGALLLALAGFAVFTRFRLSGFFRNGPGCYLALLCVQVVTAIVFSVLFQVIIVSSPASRYFEMNHLDTISSATTNIIMLIWNIFYFRKRRHLFTN